MKLTGGTYGTRWGLRSSNSLGVIAIQTIDIFIRGCYLKYPDFLSQGIRFWLGLKSAKSSQAWAHQAVSLKAKLGIYPGTLPFELWHSLNQVNGWGKVEVLGFWNRGFRDGGIHRRYANLPSWFYRLDILRLSSLIEEISPNPKAFDAIDKEIFRYKCFNIANCIVCSYWK